MRPEQIKCQKIKGRHTGLPLLIFMINIWLEFFVCAVFLSYFAYKLCKEGSVISSKTGIKESVIGLFFLAIATSFPEIITGITAIHTYNLVGLGYGDIMGSIMINSMIFLVLDYLSGKGRILFNTSKENISNGYFVLLVSFLVLLSSFLRFNTSGKGFNLGIIGLESIVIIGIYVFHTWGVHKKEHTGHIESIKKTNGLSLFSIWIKFFCFLVLVMGTGMWMAKIGDNLVANTTFSQTFIGTLFIGFATSLPEIIVSIAALRAASASMAIGNIIGSNFFDICVLAIFDFITGKPLFGMLNFSMMTLGVIVFAISLVVAWGLSNKRDSNRRLNVDTSLIFAIGLIGFVLLYYLK